MKNVNKKIFDELRKHCNDISLNSNSGHYKCKLNNGAIVIVSLCGQDKKNEWNNIKRNFRRVGVELPFKV